MYKYMYGMDTDNRQGSISEFKEYGFDAIVFTPDQEAAETASSMGLEYYAFSGAFSLPEYNQDVSMWAEDINGKKQLWFNSTCPNKDEVRRLNLENIRRLALLKHTAGVFLDGARFASPASSDDEDVFFTCFCGTCEKKAKALGFDFCRMKQDVKRLYTYFRNRGIRNAPHGISWDFFRKAQVFIDLEGVYDWFYFRRICTSEHIINFSKTIKQTDSGKKAGIYIFTPSLASLVGQCYSDISPYIDIFSPMIYRCYKPSDGPACLNREIHQFAIQLKNAGNHDDEILSFLEKTLGFDLSGYQTIEDISDGLPVSSIGVEVSRAAKVIQKKRLNIPIILLDDERLSMSVDAVKDAGADGVCFFRYEKNVWEHAKEGMQSL